MCPSLQQQQQKKAIYRGQNKHYYFQKGSVSKFKAGRVLNNKKNIFMQLIELATN